MLALAILAVALARTRLRTVVPRGLLVGALATLGIALIAVPLILLGFDDFFTGFHGELKLARTLFLLHEICKIL